MYLKNLTLFVNVCSLILFFWMEPAQKATFDSGAVLTFVLIALVNIVLFLIVASGLTSSSMRYDILFLLAFVIVHFQFPFYGAIGIEPERPDFVWINKNVVNYGVWLSAISIILWVMGFLLNIGKWKGRIGNIAIGFKNLIFLDIFIYLLFVAFLYYVGDEFLSGTYDGVDNWGTVSIYIFLLFQAGMLLRIIYMFSNAAVVKPTLTQFFRTNLLFIVLLVLVVLIFLQAGDRGIIMDIGIISAASLSFFIKPIKLTQLIVLFLLGTIFFYLIGLGRGSDLNSSDQHLLTSGLDEMEQSDNFNPTEELASSNRILFRAIDVVPEDHPHLYGLTMAFELVSMVPFGGAILFNFIEVPKIYQSSSLFFTVMGQGIHFTWGEGTEILGDIYLNFGTWGVFLLMLLHGMFISYFSYRGLLKNEINVIVLIVLISNAIYINRSTMLLIFKMLLYILVINYVFVTLLNKKQAIKQP